MVKKKVGLSFRYENYIYCLLTSIINTTNALGSLSNLTYAKIELVIEFLEVITGFYLGPHEKMITERHITLFKKFV